MLPSSGKLHHRGKHKRIISSLIFDIFHPIEFSDYVEPFLGTSSNLFQILELVENGDLVIKGNIYASDSDFRTINFYKQIQTNVNDVIDALQDFASKGLTYYTIRDNFCSDPKWGTPLNAAMFYVIHRNSFHCGGGSADVDGKKDEAFLRRISELVKRVKFENLDFREAIANAAPNSLIYIDPPTLATFTAYADIKTIIFSKLVESVRTCSKTSTIIVTSKQLEMFAKEFASMSHARFFIIPSVLNVVAAELVIIISPYLK